MKADKKPRKHDRCDDDQPPTSTPIKPFDGTPPPPDQPPTT
ncbi:MAG TPA: hypothetical protein VGK45_05430 [Thermoanaerobaculia bacterium]|jgi:hypothetical protein